MSDLGTMTPTGDTPVEETTRAVTRRRSLPGGRAVVGALLVTAAAVGVFAAYLDATATPDTRFVVAARDIAPGTRVTPEVLDAVAVDLPAEQARAAISDPADVLERIALGPVRAGDLLQATTFLGADAAGGTTTFTFAVPAARALAGALVPGEQIDIAASFGDVTAFVARRVPVVAADNGAGTGSLLVTVALDDPATVLEIAHALDNGQVHVARSDPEGAGAWPDPVVGPPTAPATE